MLPLNLCQYTVPDEQIVTNLESRLLVEKILEIIAFFLNNEGNV